MRKGKRQRGEERLGNKIMQGNGAENLGARESLLMALPQQTSPLVLGPPLTTFQRWASFLPAAPKVGEQAKLDSLSSDRIEK